MKRKITFYIIFLMILVIACKDDNKSSKSDVRVAYETIFDAHAVKQMAIYEVLKCFSNDYKNKFLATDLTKEQIDRIYKSFEEAAKYQKQVENAIRIIESNSLKSTLYLNNPQLKNTKGVADALLGFYNWVSGTGKKSRDRILTIASNLNPADRTKLYNSLRPEWKSKTKNEQDFWNKLENGEFDNQAPQMYNDFYHNAETSFPDLAQEKGLTIQKIVVKEGAEAIEKASEVLVEVTKEVTPFGKGIELAEKGIELANNIDKIFNEPSNAKEEVKQAIVNKVPNFTDVDNTTVDVNNLANKSGSSFQLIYDVVKYYSTAETWVKNTINWGLIKVIDSDSTNKKGDIIMATTINSENNPKIILASGENKGELNEGLKIMLPGGEWEFNLVDILGVTDKIISNVTNSIYSILVASTDPTSKHNIGKYSLSVWIVPADPGPNEDVTVYAKVYPPEWGLAISFSVEGTDGYYNAKTEVTNSEGICTFEIPGGGEGVVDVVTVKIVSTGATRTITYDF